MRRSSLATIASVVALALASATGLAACSEGEVDNTASDPIELARYLPENVTLIQTIDVVEARQELGLPDDANAAPTNSQIRKADSPQARLFALPSRAFPVVSDAYLLGLDARGASPLDGSLILAAAGGAGSGAVSIVSTSEPFDDVAAKLETSGYRRQRNLYLAGPQAVKTASGVVADGGSGRVIFAATERLATKVMDRMSEEAEPGVTAEALQAVNGSVRLATTEGFRSPCVEALSAAQFATGRGAIMALTVSGEKPDPDRFDARAVRSLDTGTTSVLVDALLIPFNVRRPVGMATEPITELLSYSETSPPEARARIKSPVDAYTCP